MRTEESVSISYRYLMLATRLSAKRFAKEKGAAIEWCAENGSRLQAANEAALQELQDLDRDRNPNSCAFIIYRCYADIPHGRIYNAIFDRTNVELGNETISKLCFGIFWQRLPIQSLEDGHHQLGVFDFPDGVPAIVETLPIDLFDGGRADACLGMCDFAVWNLIRKQAKNT